MAISKSMFLSKDGASVTREELAAINKRRDELVLAATAQGVADAHAAMLRDQPRALYAPGPTPGHWEFRTGKSAHGAIYAGAYCVACGLKPADGEYIVALHNANMAIAWVKA